MELSKLKEPFAAEDVEWRVQRAGRTKGGKIWALVLAYITNRAIMNRLDEVCGPENWQNVFEKGPDGGILCGIAIRVLRDEAYGLEERITNTAMPKYGDWVTKWDGADNTDVEAIKGGLSGAMKRAGVQWGIGRYLYSFETNFATVDEQSHYGEDGWHNGSFQEEKKNYRTTFWWQPPKLPEWAVPKGDK